MIRKEFSTARHTILQIGSAVNAIINTHTNDYLLEGSSDSSIRLLCRTGYTWGTVAEFMWDASSDRQLEVILECRANPSSFLTHQLQNEYQEKYISRLYDLFTKYIDDMPVPVSKPNAYQLRFKRRLGFILSTVIISVIVAIIIINYFE